MRRLLLAALVAAGLAISGTAHAITYVATLTGPGESPPNASPGTGFATVLVDPLANTMEVQVSFSGLLSTTTASHIHCCVAPPTATGVATQLPTFTGFPLGVTAGTYDHTFDLLDAATYNPAFVTANGGTTASARSALLTGLAAGFAYLNIHTTQFPSGEIRGFLSAVPEPRSWALMITGFGLAGAALRRRRRAALA
jgi:hypothetical protein